MAGGGVGVVPADTMSNLILFKEVGPNVFFGPEGHYLQDFIQLHCPKTANCHLGMFSRKTVFNKGKKTLIIRNSVLGRGPFLNICETLSLTDYAHELISDGQGEMEVLRYTLRCQGGFHNGTDAASGSNCRKVEAEKDWCRNIGTEKCGVNCSFFNKFNPTHSTTCPRQNVLFKGQCVSGCEFKKHCKRRRSKLLDHGCAFEVTITASLNQARRGMRLIQVRNCM